jgi:ornithine cyclodeaminase/alanine dehydrogenase-like protein (mu-crystallin family)
MVMMLHITEDQVKAAVSIQDAVELVEQAFFRLGQGQMVNHPRRRIRLEGGAFLHAMEAGCHVTRRFASKLYVTHPDQGARFLVTLFDSDRATILAVIDADALGQIRTGAASAVATKYMARQDASVMGLLGSGWQAESQLAAVAQVRALSEVRVYSPTKSNREKFAATMSERLSLNVRAVKSAELAVTGADIVTTITTARDPILKGKWLAPGMHINAAGSNHIKRRELDTLAVQLSQVLAVDTLEQARVEAGDLVQAADEECFFWERAVELGEIVAGRRAGRESADQITLFESQGLAAQDLVIADAVYQRVVAGG